MCCPESPLLIGAAIPASSAASVAVTSSSQFGARRATASVRRTPSAWKHVGVAMDVPQQLGVRPLRWLVQPAPSWSTDRRDPVRPQLGGPGEELVGRARKAAVGEWHGLDRCEVAWPVERRPEQVAHQAALDDGALPPEVDRTVVGADGDLDDVAVLEVLGVAACRLKNAFHFVAAGSSEAMISTGLAGALSAVPTGVPVRSRSPGSSRWNRLNAAAPRAVSRPCRRRPGRPDGSRR